MRISIKVSTDKGDQEKGQFYLSADGRVAFDGDPVFMQEMLEAKAFTEGGEVLYAKERPAAWLAALPLSYSGSRCWAEEVPDSAARFSVPKQGANASGARSSRNRF